VIKIISMIAGRPHYWHRAALATYFEVTTRSIDRDLELLRGLGYEISRSGSGYAFARTPALPAVQLSLPEAIALLLAADLALEHGDSDVATLGAALAQLQAQMPAAARTLVRRERVTGQLAGSREHRGKMLELLQVAWLEQRRARMVYETGSRDAAVTERVIEPYDVFPYQQTWMMAAFDHHRGEIRTFNVDRVRAVTLLEETYTIPTTYSRASYRGTAWGILRGESSDAVQIVLQFDVESARWAQEERRDARMTFEQVPDGATIARIIAGITPELVRWILWYGPHCRVLEPPALREQVRALAERTVFCHQEYEYNPVAMGTADQTPPGAESAAPDHGGAATP
jgi:predicted DNA-binding transcriptional regulator YafY